ncbi:ATP-binding cassette domain-containing protein [Paenibacillus rhizoplanae]
MPKPADSDIELKAVRFRYPLATRNAVEEIDLIIPNKQTLAIVGENGSGKTTLCRIIMGLYPPTAGEVWYGKVEASRTSYERTSAVFFNIIASIMRLYGRMCGSANIPNQQMIPQ